MTELSFGAKMAWQLAAQEAAAARSEFIETEHILIGIFRLEKVLGQAEEAGLEPAIRQALQSEQDAIEKVVQVFEPDATKKEFSNFCTKIRRAVRRKMGEGQYIPAEKIMHRSPACKQVFERACELTVSGELTCIQLLAAILEQPRQTIASVFDVAGLEPDELHARALANIGAETGNTGTPGRKRRRTRSTPEETEWNDECRAPWESGATSREARRANSCAPTRPCGSVLRATAPRSRGSPRRSSSGAACLRAPCCVA